VSIRLLAEAGLLEVTIGSQVSMKVT